MLTRVSARIARTESSDDTSRGAIQFRGNFLATRKDLDVLFLSRNANPDENSVYSFNHDIEGLNIIKIEYSDC